jgi:hypothetical protein
LLEPPDPPLPLLPDPPEFPELPLPGCEPLAGGLLVALGEDELLWLEPPQPVQRRTVTISVKNAAAKYPELCETRGDINEAPKLKFRNSADLDGAAVRGVCPRHQKIRELNAEAAMSRIAEYQKTPQS